MIENKKDLLFYLEQDRLALGKSKARPPLVGDEIWKYQRLLRKTEYWSNTKKQKNLKLSGKLFFHL